MLWAYNQKFALSPVERGCINKHNNKSMSLSLSLHPPPSCSLKSINKYFKEERKKSLSILAFLLSVTVFKVWHYLPKGGVNCYTPPCNPSTEEESGKTVEVSIEYFHGLLWCI